MPRATHASPTASPCKMARWPSAAAILRAYSSLLIPTVPNPIDPLVSTTRQHRRLVSASNSLTKKRSDRPNARQSSRLRSSPGTYFRYSANSTLDPRCGLGCRPETFPCIGRRGKSGNPASRASTPGSRKLRELRSGNIEYP